MLNRMCTRSHALIVGLATVLCLPITADGIELPIRSPQSVLGRQMTAAEALPLNVPNQGVNPMIRDHAPSNSAPSLKDRGENGDLHLTPLPPTTVQPLLKPTQIRPEPLSPEEEQAVSNSMGATMQCLANKKNIVVRL